MKKMLCKFMSNILARACDGDRRTAFRNVMTVRLCKRMATIVSAWTKEEPSHC
jgi:hypothetical protein